MSAVAAAIAGGLVSSAGQMLANQQMIDANNARFGDQINLANTAHQREVMDLKAAGLNPILSASGSGAAVPQLGTPELGNSLTGVGEGLTAAGKLAALDVPLKESQVALNSAQAQNLISDGELKRVQAEAVKRAKSSFDDLVEETSVPSRSFGEWLGDRVNSAFGVKEYSPKMSPRMTDYLIRDPDRQEKYFHNKKKGKVIITHPGWKGQE